MKETNGEKFVRELTFKVVVLSRSCCLEDGELWLVDKEVPEKSRKHKRYVVVGKRLYVVGRNNRMLKCPAEDILWWLAKGEVRKFHQELVAIDGDWTNLVIDNFELRPRKFGRQRREA